MHRVELKAIKAKIVELKDELVPNAPCGVERYNLYSTIQTVYLVLSS